MISNLYFCILSFFYSILLLLKCRNKKDSLKHNVFRLLVLTNFIGIIIGFSCFYTVLNYETIPILNYIVSRIYLVYLLVWILLFTTYIFVISYNLKTSDNLFKKIKKSMYLLFAFIVVLIFILPLNYFNKNNMVYSYGMAAQLIYVLSEILTLVCLFCMFKNSKRFNINKYSPLFIYIVGGIIVMLIQSSHPELLLLTSMEVFVTYMIYFTIEDDGKSSKKIEKEKK